LIGGNLNKYTAPQPLVCTLTIDIIKFQNNLCLLFRTYGLRIDSVMRPRSSKKGVQYKCLSYSYSYSYIESTQTDSTGFTLFWSCNLGNCSLGLGLVILALLMVLVFTFWSCLIPIQRQIHY